METESFIDRAHQAADWLSRPPGRGQDALDRLGKTRIGKVARTSQRCCEIDVTDPKPVDTGDIGNRIDILGAECRLYLGEIGDLGIRLAQQLGDRLRLVLVM